MEQEVLSELNMSHMSLEEGVKNLKDWIRQEPHLPNVIDEQFLQSFIIGSKSVEKAKERLEKYFTVRTKYSDIFSKRDPETIEWQKAIRTISLEDLTPEHYSVILCRTPLPDEVKDFDMINVLRVWFMVIDEELRARPFTSGQVVAVDCSNFSFRLLLKIPPRLTAAAVDSYQNAYPVRIKHMVYFNAPSLFSAFYNHVMKYFYTKKMRERIHIYSEDHTILQKYLPENILPSDYGGSKPSIDELYERIQEKLKGQRNWFMNEGDQHSDEAKRITI